jgi:hypothetical protein
MKDTKAVGDVSEAVVLAELLKAGKSVLLPFGERHKYDLVVDEDGVFRRVQCKTGRIIKGTLTFNTCSVVRDAKLKKFVRRYYKHTDVDFFGVYCPDNKKAYLIPFGDVAKTVGSFRITPSNISTGMGGKLAAQYELNGERAG